MNKITATIGMAVSMMIMIGMYFSGKFIPVYVNGEYILANQLIRYIIYIILFIVVMYNFAYLLYAQDHRKRNRHQKRGCKKSPTEK